MTKEALEASIVKWDKNAQAEVPGEAKAGRRDCPLCDIYWYADCNGCPVKSQTGIGCCAATPYPTAAFALARWGGSAKEDDTCADGGEFRAAARAEAAFLREVLAAQYPEAEA